MSQPLNLPDLDPIDAPDGAMAAATQVLVNNLIAYPWGFSNRSTVVDVPHMMHVPAVDSSMWFKELFRGYMTAQTMHFLGDKMPDLRTLVAAESAELVARVANPNAVRGLDDSQRPRGLAVWVHVHDKMTGNVMGERFLDALAEWGTGVSGDIRTSILAGGDGELMLHMIRGESVATQEINQQWSFRVCIRWSCPKDRGLRSEYATFDHVPASTNATLVAVQQAVVRLVGIHGVEFPTVLMRCVRNAVPRHAFAYIQNRLACNFTALCSSEPSVTLNKAASTPESGPLESTGVVVRLCNKALGAPGIVNNSSFHGIVLSTGARRDDALAFVEEAIAGSDKRLRVPIGMQEETMGLHVCAVQAERRTLGPLVSLFSPVGVAGKPIHSPHSWVWVENAAIRPIDANLLNAFDARPCSKACIVPRNEALALSYKTHFKRASDLYLSLGKDGANSDPVDPTDANANANTSPLPPSPSVERCEVALNDRFILAAMRVDLLSQRTTIGEAYAYLCTVGPPSSVTKMMIHTAGRLGINSPLSSMLDLCISAVQLHEAPEALLQENQRLKRLADVALSALVDEPCAKRGPCVTVASADRIRRLLAAAGVKRGIAVNVTLRQSDVSNIVNAVIRAVRVETPLNASDSVLRAVSKGITSYCDVGDIVGRAARLLFLSNEFSFVPAIYMISSEAETNAIRVDQLALSCAPTPATLDQLCAEATPSVLIVQKMCDGRVRLTPTVSA